MCADMGIYSRGAEGTKIALNNIKEAKMFDTVRHSMHKYENQAPRMQRKVERCKHCGLGTCQDCSAYGKQCGTCGNPNHFKVVCMSAHQQQPDHWVGREAYKISQEDEPQTVKEEGQDRSFEIVKVKYTYLDSVKSVIFTKLASSTSPRRTQITYKVDLGSIVT